MSAAQFTVGHGTVTVRPTPPRHGPLLQRLRETEKRKSYVAFNRTAPPVESEYDAPINPDGNEAASAIEVLDEALTAFLDAWDNIDKPFQPEMPRLCEQARTALAKARCDA